MPSETPAARTQVNTLHPPYIPARILWPALGFPEIVDPSAAASPGNHTASIRLILIAATPSLSRYEVARHLRWAAWQQRRTRFLPRGTQAFPPEAITVLPVPSSPIASDLSYKRSIANGAVAVGLAKKVWSIYAGIWKGSATLYEITISQGASAALSRGLYHLFWINRDPADTEQNPSEEMSLLLENFVKPRLAREFPLDRWVNVPAAFPYKDAADMAVDYEYEWNGPRLPKQAPSRRVEVLPPLFIGPASSGGRLRIGHVTDLHLGTREDVFEQLAHEPMPCAEEEPDLEQLQHTPDNEDRLLRHLEEHPFCGGARVPKSRWPAFNHPNQRVAEIYRKAKANCDVLLLTGDLVDFGRGHAGDGSAPLGEIGNYWLDRNWFVFYRLLAQDDLYAKPVYTNLGNHDWRINPYPPLGYFKTHQNYNLTEEEMARIHGEGGTELFDKNSWTDYPKALVDWAISEDRVESMPNTGMPLVTTIHAVGWYLLVINPFLDYSVRLPDGYALLMLDWSRDEQVRAVAGGDDPVAGDSLNEVQAQLVTHFLAQDVQAKILGIHAPLIGPNQYWPTDQLREGWVKRNGRRFPIVAMGNPNEHSTEFPAGDQPAHGTIKLWRFWLLQQLRDRRVSLVLSGHLHRRAMFMIANPQKAKPHQDLRDGMALCLIESELNRFWYDHGPPLFVNTTCAGPIGHNVPFAGGPEVPVPPGYNEIQMENDGRVIEVKEKYADHAPPAAQGAGR